MSGWYVTQGCFLLSHVTPIAKPVPGQPIQALGPLCSVRVMDLMLETFGPHFYTVLRAVMITCFVILLSILMIQASRLAWNLKQHHGFTMTETLKDPQLSMYIGWIVSCIVMIFWFVDPYETIGVYGKVGGKILVSVMMFSIFSTMMWMMYNAWNGILQSLGILTLPAHFMRYFLIVLACLYTFTALPLSGSLLYGLQALCINIFQVFFSVLNSYLGWLVLKQYRLSVENLKSQGPASRSSDAGSGSDTSLKIILIAFGISSSTFGAFLISAIIPVTFFIDAASGSDLQKAYVQSSALIVWRIFVIICGVSVGAVTGVGYFVYAFRNVSRESKRVQ